MKKMLILENCKMCPHHESNMYYGECCWNRQVITATDEGDIPKTIPILHPYSGGDISIPSWCPLPDIK